MKKISKKIPSAEAIARMADKGKMMLPIQRVNVDFTQTMLDELDVTAKELNISRQAVIKTFVRQALNQHYMARQPQSSPQQSDPMKRKKKKRIWVKKRRRRFHGQSRIVK